MSGPPDLAPPHPRERSPASILIVDDDRATLLALSTLLQDLGDQIVCAASAEEALRCLLREDFAIILLDVVMPGMDGYEAAAMIRRRERSRDVPIIFLSAINRDDAHMYRGYSAGAVDYVFKPVEPVVLRSKVATFVELHRKTEEVRRKAEMEKRLLAENLRARTEQMQIVEALERSKAQQSLVIETLPIALYVAHPGRGFSERHFVGGRIERLCGFSGETFLRSPATWLARIHADDRDRVRAGLSRLGENGTFAAEYRWQCADGSYRYFLDHGVLVDGAGGTQEMFGTWLDVSERRLLEQQLAHSQKMKAVGQLTGGIAHDFNNMLTVIIGSLDRLRYAAEGDAQAARRIDIALQGALSCADLTRRLLGFARPQPVLQQRLDLNQQLQGLRELLDRTLGGQIKIVFDCADDVWPVSSDPAQLESAVLNLLINARDAMPGGGEVTIATANRTFGERAAGLDGLEPGDYAELMVRDNGVGMAPEVMERAFDPFFTTKLSGKGTGLGLSTIYGFARQSNGGVSLSSEPGQGTTVRLYLPRAELFQERPEPDAPQPGIALDLGGRPVLVVEDEPEVRDIAAAILGELGCEVLMAGDGEGALRILADRKDVELLFTDWAMPGSFNGRQLAEEAARRLPGLRVLFTSAYGDKIDMKQQGGGKPHFLPKPYRASQLAEAVRAALS